MTIAKEVRVLVKRYPLPEGWSYPKVSYYSVLVGVVEIRTLQLASKCAGGILVNSCASELNNWGTTRCYFELLERIAQVKLQTMCQKISRSVLLDKTLWNQKSSSQLRFKDLLSPRRIRSDWEYCLSNGIAAHRTVQLANKSAAFEAIERDQILRSWYGEFAPAPIDCLIKIPTSLLKTHEYLFYSFGSLRRDVAVIGVFGFPRFERLAFTIGFGCSETLEGASEHAFRESLQSWNPHLRKIQSDRLPRLKSTPDYHRSFFTRRKNYLDLRAWLEGKLLDRNYVAIPPVRSGSWKEEFRFVEFGQSLLAQSVPTVKAISPHRLRLTFGLKNPDVLMNPDHPRIIHPIG